MFEGIVTILLSTLVTLEIEYTLSFWIVLFLTICSSEIVTLKVEGVKVVDI
jgi:hypothetical protein